MFMYYESNIYRVIIQIYRTVVHVNISNSIRPKCWWQKMLCWYSSSSPGEIAVVGDTMQMRNRL